MLRAWTGLFWFSIGSSGRFLRTQRRTFGFHKKTTQLPRRLLAPQRLALLCWMELVSQPVNSKVQPQLLTCYSPRQLKQIRCSARQIWVSLSVGGVREIGRRRAESLLTLILLMWRIWWAPNSASRWQMGFNPYPGNVENMVSSY